MAHVIQPFINSLQGLMIPERREQSRRELKGKLEIVRLAAVVMAAAFAILFLAIPKILTFIFFLPPAYLFFEAATLSGNLQDLVDRIAIDGVGGLNRDNVIAQATRAAPLTRALARFAITRLAPQE